MKEKEYALYKGEELLAIGTAKEIAKEMKVKPATIYYYGSKAYRNKLEKQGRIKNNVKIAVQLN